MSDYVCTKCGRVKYDPATRPLLSARENEVAHLVISGLQSKEIGTKIFLSEKTVKFHLTNIYKKLGFVSRYELIAECLRNPQILSRTVAEDKRRKRKLHFDLQP